MEVVIHRAPTSGALATIASGEGRGPRRFLFCLKGCHHAPLRF